MRPPADRLVHHLALAVALKLAVLTGLWWTFVRDARVGVDVESAAAHLGARSDGNSSIPATHTPPTGAEP